jgi:hypothetical protein
MWCLENLFSSVNRHLFIKLWWLRVGRRIGARVPAGIQRLTWDYQRGYDRVLNAHYYNLVGVVV